MKPDSEVVCPGDGKRARVLSIKRYGSGPDAYQRVTVETWDGESRAYLRSELIPVLVTRPQRALLAMVKGESA